MAPTRQSTTRRPRNFDYPVPLNGGMTKNYLAQVEEDARRLRLSLRDDDTLPAWVNAYVFTSADRMQTASRYMDQRVRDYGGTALLSMPTSAQLGFRPSEYSYGVVSTPSVGKSQNGWPASPSASAIDIVTVPLAFKRSPNAKQKSIRVTRKAADALEEIALWWEKHIEPIETIYGYNYREIRGTEGSGTISNHGSGTAIDINAEKHPLGARGTIPPAKVAQLVAKSTSLGLRWGGLYRSRADEMHLEVILPPTADMFRKVGSTITTIWIGTSIVGLVGLAGFLAVKKWKTRRQQKQLEQRG